MRGLWRNLLHYASKFNGDANETDDADFHGFFKPLAIILLNPSALAIKRLSFLASLLVALALLVYIAIRAVKVGFTHDESSSFMNLIQEPIRDLFFSERNWQAANNHILNTLCMQMGHYFFGAEEWALRWGSVVAGFIFLAYALRTLRLWLPVSAWIFFGTFCIFVLNHFVIDFFSLARGYGLSLAFEMATLYYFFRWIKQYISSEAVTGSHRLTTPEPGNLFKAGCALGAGILSNFVLLDLMAAFFLSVTIIFYVKNKNSFSFGKWFRLIVLPILPILATMLLIFQPLRWINAQGEFEYGPQGFWETWRVLVERFTYHPSLDYSWLKVIILVVATFLFLLLGYVIFKRFKGTHLSETLQPTESYAGPLLCATLLTVLTMLMTVVQHYLLGANYLIGRTAVLLYPLLSSVVALYLIDLRPSKPRRFLKPTRFISRYNVLWTLVTVALIINFCSQINLRFASEWPYDENTKAAALFADQQGSATNKINYGVGWLYYSTTIFYQETLGLNNITVEQNAGHDNLFWVTSRPFDLIYVEKKLQPKLKSTYVLFKMYPQGVMMKRK